MKYKVVQDQQHDARTNLFGTINFNFNNNENGLQLFNFV